MRCAGVEVSGEVGGGDGEVSVVAGGNRRCDCGGSMYVTDVDERKVNGGLDCGGVDGVSD